MVPMHHMNQKRFPRSKYSSSNRLMRYPGTIRESMHNVQNVYKFMTSISDSKSYTRGGAEDIDIKFIKQNATSGTPSSNYPLQHRKILK